MWYLNVFIGNGEAKGSLSRLSTRQIPSLGTLANSIHAKKSVTIRARGHFTEARSHRQVGI